METKKENMTAVTYWKVWVKQGAIKLTSNSH